MRLDSLDETSVWKTHIFGREIWVWCSQKSKINKAKVGRDFQGRDLFSASSSIHIGAIWSTPRALWWTQEFITSLLIRTVGIGPVSLPSRAFLCYFAAAFE